MKDVKLPGQGNFSAISADPRLIAVDDPAAVKDGNRHHPDDNGTDLALALQLREKEALATELILANAELTLLNNEKEQRAAELVIANKELSFQNHEKENRASELIIANAELLYQNAEKEKRAAELVIANDELAYQNGEKDNRAAELSIANLELAYQNAEKEKRAAELIIANDELAYQNEEKDNRAAELTIANLELAYQNAEKEKRAAELSITNIKMQLQDEKQKKTTAALLTAEKSLHAQQIIIKFNEALEQKVAERTAQLEFANKELESFSYSVSHDLRAPLRAVNGYAQILVEDYSERFDDEGRRLLGIVQNSAKRMGQLIDDLLAFSRLGSKQINKTNVNMAQLVDTIVNEMQMANPVRASIRIKTVLPVIADNPLMRQVWINLLSNAIKYSFNAVDPQIEIDSVAKDDTVVYSVSDNGVGFEMQYADKIFGVFQRLHDSEEYEGTGVGLALVRRIINKHGGTIWATAKAGEGATFYFALPARN